MESILNVQHLFVDAHKSYDTKYLILALFPIRITTKLIAMIVPILVLK